MMHHMVYFLELTSDQLWLFIQCIQANRGDCNPTNPVRQNNIFRIQIERLSKGWILC